MLRHGWLFSTFLQKELTKHERREKGEYGVSSFREDCSTAHGDFCSGTEIYRNRPLSRGLEILPLYLHPINSYTYFYIWLYLWLSWVIYSATNSYVYISKDCLEHRFQIICENLTLFRRRKSFSASWTSVSFKWVNIVSLPPQLNLRILSTQGFIPCSPESYITYFGRDRLIPLYPHWYIHSGFKLSSLEMLFLPL